MGMRVKEWRALMAGVGLCWLAGCTSAQQEGIPPIVKGVIGGQVLTHRAAMGVPSTVFGRWEADQWGKATVDCLLKEGDQEGASRVRFPAYGAGSYQLMSNAGCLALVAGPNAKCFELGSMVGVFQSPPRDLPLNYLYLPKGSKFQGGAVDIGGYCELVEGQQSTRQFFAGKGVFKWIGQPQRTGVNTAQGMRELLIGTGSLEVEGMPGTGSIKAVVVMGE